VPAAKKSRNTCRRDLFTHIKRERIEREREKRERERERF